ASFAGTESGGAATSGSNTSAKSGNGIIQRPRTRLAPGSLPALIQSRMVSDSPLSTWALWSANKHTRPGYGLGRRPSIRPDIDVPRGVPSRRTRDQLSFHCGGVATGRAHGAL